ncbi:MAG: hypothetical protein IT204_16010 [Fimbriimonadaceae bacterium]|nr:hypothetical protein [Fimbriimonadaceae bacterium]
MRRARPWWVLALLAAGALPGGRLAAQAPADPPALLRQQVRSLEVIAGLGFSRPQAAALLRQLADMRRTVAEIEAARRQMHLEAGSAMATLENALLAGQPLDNRLLSTVDTAWRRCEQVRVAQLRRQTEVATAIWTGLSDAQRFRVETAENERRRLAQEETYTEAWLRGIDLALRDLGEWVRAADATTFQRERVARIQQVLNTAYPGVEAVRLAVVANQLGGLYDRVRALRPDVVLSQRAGWPAQVRSAMPPLNFQASYTFVVSASEWGELIRSAVFADMLVRRLDTLPAGG